MDEEQTPKINPNNFFESIERIDKVASDALGKSNSNFTIIGEQKGLIESLSSSIETIQSEVQQITQFLIVQQDQREKDLGKQEDILAAQEDQQQKQKRKDLLSGKKPGEEGKGGATQQAIDNAIKSAPAMQLFGGLAAMLLSQIMPDSSKNDLDFLSESDASALGTPEDKIKNAEKQLENLKERIELEKERKNKDRNSLQRFFFGKIMGEDAEYDKMIKDEEKRLERMQKQFGKDNAIVDKLIRKAEKGNVLATQQLNFLKTGELPEKFSGGFLKNPPAALFDNKIFVGMSPSLLERAYFTEGGLEEFKLPSLPTSKLRSRFELDLSDYNPKDYPVNIQEERNTSDKLKEIEEKGDGKALSEYKTETKRLIDQAKKDLPKKREERIEKEKIEEEKIEKNKIEKNKIEREEKKENDLMSFVDGGGIVGAFSRMISGFDGTPGSRETKDAENKGKDIKNEGKDIKNEGKDIKVVKVEDTKPKYYADYIKEGVKITEIGPNDFSFEFPDGSTRISTSTGSSNAPTVEGRFDALVDARILARKEEEKREKEREKERLEFGKKMYESFPDSYNPDGTRKETKKFKDGGLVDGEKGVDKIPAMLTDGEFVLTPKAVDMIGSETLNALNTIADSGKFKVEPNELSDADLSSPESKNEVKVLSPINASSAPVNTNPNSTVMPKSPSNVNTSKINDTNSPVPFIELISNHSLSV